MTTFQIQLHYGNRTIYLINELVQQSRFTTYSVGFQTQLMRQKNVQFTQNSSL